MGKATIHRLVVVTFYVLMGFGILVYLQSLDWESAKSVRINFGWLLLAALFGIATRVWQVEIWVTVLRNLGATGLKIDLPLTLIYAKSWLGRYIPGLAPWILGKIYFGARHGISTARLAVGSVVEAGTQVTVLVLVSAVALSFDFRFRALNEELLVGTYLVAVLCLVALSPRVFNTGVSIVVKLLRRAPLDDRVTVSRSMIYLAVIQYGLAAIGGGLSLFFLVRSLYPQVTISDVWLITASACIAGAAGMIAVFAPAGIGVRDSVLLVSLLIILPPTVATVVVVAARILEIVLDLIFFLGSLLLNRAYSRSTRTS